MREPDHGPARSDLEQDGRKQLRTEIRGWILLGGCALTLCTAIAVLWKYVLS